jgi:predicted RNA-binding protein
MESDIYGRADLTDIFYKEENIDGRAKRIDKGEALAF